MRNEPIEVIAGPRFMREIHRLRKKYPHVREDVKPVTDIIENGDTPGDRVTEVGSVVYKVRIRNRDAQRGKSGGYRMLYYLKTANRIFLLTIYSKSERTDMPLKKFSN